MSGDSDMKVTFSALHLLQGHAGLFAVRLLQGW